MPFRSSCAALLATTLALASCNDHDLTPPALTGGPLFSHTAGHPEVRFSELHYDNTGTDTGEAIEISGPAGTDLTGWSIVLYNGAATSLAPYNTTALSGTIPATCDPPRAQYTASWNPTRGTPNWVSYNLEATHFGDEDRCDCFTFDPELGAGSPGYTTAAYTGAGTFHGFGIDRGHLARSFDRTAGSLDNATTFYFTNIVPQAADLNQGPWSVLEMFLGDKARFENNEVYVVTGVAGAWGTVKDEGRIVIPASTWKVAVILPRDRGLAHITSHRDFELVAVLMPNEAGIRNVNWETYRTTVNTIEAASGYDVLALLPDEIEFAVESGTHTVEALVEPLVLDGKLGSGNANSLEAKLQAAAQQLDRGNRTAGVNQLQAFLREVDALERSGRLGAADTAALRDAVMQVVASVAQ